MINFQIYYILFIEKEGINKKVPSFHIYGDGMVSTGRKDQSEAFRTRVRIPASPPNARLVEWQIRLAQDEGSSGFKSQVGYQINASLT